LKSAAKKSKELRLPVKAKIRQRIILRRPRITDVDQLMKIERQSFRAHRFSRQQFLYYIHEETSIFAVAESEGELIGYIAGTVHGEKGKCNARLYSMAVLAQWRRDGVGARLLTYFETETGRRKCGSIVLQVRPNNRPAQALYRKFGYSRTAVLRDYYGRGKPGLEMRKTLEKGI
jgi:ribosomal-protein-alanine acetyltransferase